MTRNKTGNNQFLKVYNKTFILELIRVNKALSRAELSQLTGLSATAIGSIVLQLLGEGYIVETGTGDSSGGRKPMMLQLKDDSFYSIGVDLEVDSISIVLLDITANVVEFFTIQSLNCSDVKVVVTAIERSVNSLLRKYNIDKSRLIGIGISIPGMVQSESRRIILAPNLGWKDVDLGEYFRKYTSIYTGSQYHLNKSPQSGLQSTSYINFPIYIENEAMASAICENWIGCCQEVNDFVCINIKSGIGAGIFTGGRLYRGVGGSAGEVGHIVVDEEGQKCACGNYGCIETKAATPRLLEITRKHIKQGTTSILNKIDSPGEINLEDIIAAANEGDDTAKNLLSEAARYLGIAISSIVNTLNPSKIVMGKDFVKYSPLVMETLKGVVKCKALEMPAAMVEIEASGFGEKSSALGAAIVPLKTLFGK